MIAYLPAIQMNSQAAHCSPVISAFLLLFASCSQGGIQPEDNFSFSDTVQYSIHRDEANDMYRSIDVQLNRSVEESTLKAIAQEIVNREVAQYTRTSIVYYLPPMVVGNGAWAYSSTSHGSTHVTFNIPPEAEEAIRRMGLDSFTGPPEAELVERLAEFQDRLAALKLRFGDDYPGLVSYQNKIDEIEKLLARYRRGQ